MLSKEIDGVELPITGEFHEINASTRRAEK
jgi:hypothetical protein